MIGLHVAFAATKSDRGVFGKGVLGDFADRAARGAIYRVDCGFHKRVCPAWYIVSYIRIGWIPTSANAPAPRDTALRDDDVSRKIGDKPWTCTQLDKCVVTINRTDA